MPYFSCNLKCLNTTLAKPFPLLRPHFAAWLPSAFCSQAVVLISWDVQMLLFYQLILGGVCMYCALMLLYGCVKAFSSCLILK